MIILRRSRYLVAAPPAEPVLHVATFLRRAPGWEQARKFARLNRDVEAQLMSSPGALAYSLQRLLVGEEAWTLSLWKDRKSMTDFVRSGSHHLAAEWLRSTEENVGTFTHWEAAQPSLSWDEAYDRLGVPRPTGRVLVAPIKIPPGWRSVPR